MGFSFRKKNWPRYTLATSPELVRHVSGLYPPLVRLVLLALAASPELVRIVLLALNASPELVRHVSATCPPWVVGYGPASCPCPPLHLSALYCWLWPRLQPLSALCPPLVRLVFQSLSATCPPYIVGFGRASGCCPPLVRLLFALCCWLWPRLQSLSATYPPCIVGFGRASSFCPPLVRLLSALCCWLRPRLQSLSAACPPCVRTCPLCIVGFGRASSFCPPLVRLLSALCCWLRPRLQSLSAACPPCVRTCPLCIVGFGRASNPFLPFVRLMLLALAAPPALVRHLPALCSPLVCLFGFGHASSPCPPLFRLLWPHFQSLSATCPPCVCHLSALCCRVWPRLQSLPALCCWLWSRLRSLSAMCLPCVRLVLLALAAPPVLVRYLSAWCPLRPCVPQTVNCGFFSQEKKAGRVPRACRPCVRHRPLAHHVSTSCLMSGLSPLWPRFQILSTMCPPCACNFVRDVSALCPSLCASGFGRLSKLGRPSAWACVRLVSGLVSTLALPCLPCVCLAFCPSCVR